MWSSCTGYVLYVYVLIVIAVAWKKITWPSTSTHLQSHCVRQSIGVSYITIIWSLIYTHTSSCTETVWESVLCVDVVWVSVVWVGVSVCLLYQGRSPPVSSWNSLLYQHQWMHKAKRLQMTPFPCSTVADVLNMLSVWSNKNHCYNLHLIFTFGCTTFYLVPGS